MKKYLITALAILSLVQCKKKDAPKPWYPSGTPNISDVQLTDFCDGIITITGVNFDSVPKGVSVALDSLPLQLLSATQTKLVVRVPATVFSGSIYVTSEHLSLYWPATLTKGPTVIDSVSPIVAGTGTMITLSGHFFNPNAAADTVYFNHIPATVLSASATQIVARVPAGATTGQVAVQSNCQSAVAKTNFTLSNKGTVYVGSHDGNFYAIDVASGGPKWLTPLPGGGTSPAFANGVLYMAGGDGNDSNLYALDANTGAKLWSFKAASPWQGTPAVYQGVVYLGTSVDNTFHAVDATTGQQKWSYKSSQPGDGWGVPSVYNGSVYASCLVSSTYSLDLSTGALNWSRGSLSPGSPVAVGGLVYVSGYDSSGEMGVLYALNAADGSIAWTNPIYQLNGSPTVSNGVVYVGSYEHFYAFNAATGAQIWSVPQGSLYTAPQIVDNTIYFASTGVVVSLNTANGQQNWYNSLVQNTFYQGGLVVAHGVIYVGGNDGGVYALDAGTGKVIWTCWTHAGVESTPCVVDSAGAVFQAQQ
ncbi:MAG TPA: PQQ-binding-like beta-propeller repeat protein [Dinghuibacter sp.]|uniref:outer membrane protein assembly factor BamB family protein n=1 Tax=Dinghuibacter sp. TaxID=2024697 RepID=UPI002C7DA3CB|nr:PQQ-binding-like beta-propeller repeat protein [Dinghuibacter sp.]HTJ12197.1 PQQ-binding-like beta-propeller repeat protein [Dinghuibacter sp.]